MKHISVPLTWLASFFVSVLFYQLELLSFDELCRCIFLLCMAWCVYCIVNLFLER